MDKIKVTNLLLAERLIARTLTCISMISFWRAQNFFRKKITKKTEFKEKGFMFLG